MSGYLKLFLLFLCLGIVGYSYKWAFDKGFDNGQAEYKIEGAKMLSDALRDQDLMFKELRSREMREAAEIAKNLNIQSQKKISGLKKLNDELKNNKSLQSCVGVELPDNIIGVLNESRGDLTSEQIGALPSGSNDQVPTTPKATP